jgi:hypothetical protein
MREQEKNDAASRQLYDKKTEIANERGKNVARLKQQKDELESKRQQILSDLEKVKRGDFSNLY